MNRILIPIAIVAFLVGSVAASVQFAQFAAPLLSHAVNGPLEEPLNIDQIHIYTQEE